MHSLRATLIAGLLLVMVQSAQAVVVDNTLKRIDSPNPKSEAWAYYGNVSGGNVTNFSFAALSLGASLYTMIVEIDVDGLIGNPSPSTGRVSVDPVSGSAPGSFKEAVGGNGQALWRYEFNGNLAGAQHQLSLDLTSYSFGNRRIMLSVVSNPAEYLKSTAVVPEPSTWALMLVGLAWLLRRAQRGRAVLR